MQSEPAIQRMTHPRTVEEALRDLSVDGAVPVAGATWVMRAPLRRQDRPACFVSLGGVAGFQRIDAVGDTATIGPMATHDALARHLPESTGFAGLRAAAGCAANPGVRRLATLGGNICAADFAASDFAPALLACDAIVEIATPTGSRQISLERFLADRAAMERPWLLTGIVIGRQARLSSHQRLPMRLAGDYPCAIVSVSVAIDGAGVIEDARIGVGAVEASAQRWHGLEQALTGSVLGSVRAGEAARDLAADFTGRDGLDAPGWYRTSVLPVLVRRAFDAIRVEQAGQIR